MLRTFVASTSMSVLGWATRRWRKEMQEPTTEAEDDVDKLQPEGDWWAVKASAGNGGGDVYFINESNYRSVLRSIPVQMEYVIQRYVKSPMLYQGKKFHFRCYSTMHADGMAMVYDMGFVLCCGVPYDANSSDPTSHITNLSINKKMDDHPGQIPSLLSAIPGIFEQICDIWAAVVNEAFAYMTEQRSHKHFEFFGLDIIVDKTGMCWLIEINRLPGLESSNNRMKEDEDIMYDDMMTRLLDVVLENQRTEDSEDHAKWHVVRPASTKNTLDVQTVDGKDGDDTSTSPLGAFSGSKDIGAINILRWKMFTRHVRDKVIVDIKLI